MVAPCKRGCRNDPRAERFTTPRKIEPASLRGIEETGGDKSPRADLRCIILEITEARHATVRARLQVLIKTLSRR